MYSLLCDHEQHELTGRVHLLFYSGTDEAYDGMGYMHRSTLPAGCHLPAVATSSNDLSPSRHTSPHEAANINTHWDHIAHAESMHNASFSGAAPVAPPRHSFRVAPSSLPELAFAHQVPRSHSYASSVSSPEDTAYIGGTTPQQQKENDRGHPEPQLGAQAQLLAPPLMHAGSRPGQAENSLRPLPDWLQLPSAQGEKMPWSCRNLELPAANVLANARVSFY